MRRTGTRGNKRVARPGIVATLKAADRRARQRSNQRMCRRRGLTSMRSAIEGVGYAPPETLSLSSRILRILWGLVLLPVCGVTTVTLFECVTDPAFTGHFWRTDVFIYFTVGFVLHIGWFFSHFFQNVFLYLYVLGHELTHALFVYICFGYVSGFRVGVDGGHVVTNKSNLLIALSPYFIPFWSVVVLAIAAPISLMARFPGQDQALFLLMGATWSFHLLWTLWIIPRDQPDLKENGTFLSLAIIYLANILLIAALLCAAFPQLIDWRVFLGERDINAYDLLEAAYEGLASLPDRADNPGLVRRLLLIVLLVCAGPFGGLCAAPRVWRDTGGRTLTGSYITSNEDNVFIKLDTNKTSEIPLGLLSNRDLEFVRARRAALAAQGIVAEAPLVWESYRSKKLTAAQAEKLGYFPIGSGGSESTLKLQFQRYGPPPKPDAKLVLRLHTPSTDGAGTTSAIQVLFNDKIVGSAHGAPPGAAVDIRLNAALLARADHLELTVRGGSDTVFVRTKNSGKGAQLAILK